MVHAVTPKIPVNAQSSDKKNAGLAKGRATQQLAKGRINAGNKNVIDTKANRVIGHTFHSIKGQG